MKTYKFKLYSSKRNKKLHRQINIAGSIYNHCIALHRRYYRIFKSNSSAIAKANRRLARKKQSSAKKNRMKNDLCRLYKKTANQRNDFHWKLANKLCGKYAVVSKIIR